MSAQHEEDSCRLLNEDGTPISVDELINAHRCNIEQHSATLPNGITNEGLNHQHSIPSNVAADSTSTPAREGSVAAADSSGERLSKNAAKNPLANHQSTADEILYGMPCKDYCTMHNKDKKY